MGTTAQCHCSTTLLFVNNVSAEKLLRLHCKCRLFATSVLPVCGSHVQEICLMLYCIIHCYDAPLLRECHIILRLQQTVQNDSGVIVQGNI